MLSNLSWENTSVKLNLYHQFYQWKKNAKYLRNIFYFNSWIFLKISLNNSMMMLYKCHCLNCNKIWNSWYQKLISDIVFCLLSSVTLPFLYVTALPLLWKFFSPSLWIRTHWSRPTLWSLYQYPWHESSLRHLRKNSWHGCVVRKEMVYVYKRWTRCVYWSLVTWAVNLLFSECLSLQKLILPLFCLSAWMWDFAHKWERIVQWLCLH